MALNFTVSYTFSPGTTISSSQVNTNTTDVATVFTGLEAETKTLAKLKVDIDPTAALNVATKQYVDHYSTWRRPVLQYATATTVAVESGLDGTSGNIPIQFPDGTMRTEATSTRTTFDITRNAVLTTSGAQSGLTGATSEAANTWYALYAVKVTDSSTLWVTIGSTVLPLQANYATLNTAYGTSGWVYLGLIRNGDNSGATGDILNFRMAGNTTYLINTCTGNVLNHPGLRLASTAGATSIEYDRTSGTGTTDLPANIVHAYLVWLVAADSTNRETVRDQQSLIVYAVGGGASVVIGGTFWEAADDGMIVSSAGSVARDIGLAGFFDRTLGVGSNPLL